jgi:predicted  nucleic acid-binding Zn-ribbon protein
VVEEHVFETTHALANITPDLLASFVQNKELSETARNQLAKIAALKADIAATQREIQDTEKRRNDLGTDLSRLQQNISTLRQVSGQQEQVQKYARDLAAGTAEAATLGDRIAELRKKQAAAEADLGRLIETLEF